MKKNIINFLAIALIISSCSNDNPVYSELKLSETSVKVETNGVANVDFLSGNGEYILESNDDKIAVANIEGNSIQITGVSKGVTQILVRDWAKKHTSIDVLVKYLPVDEVILSSESATIDVGEEFSFTIFQGNANTYEGYKLSSSDDAIAVALVKDESISVQGVSPGDAVITVVDELDFTAEFLIKVLAKLRELKLDLEIPNALYLYLEKGTENIKILDGNGDYKISIPANSGVTAELADESINLTGTKESSSTLTVTDSRDQKVDVAVVAVGDYLNLHSTRSLYKRSFYNRAYSSTTTSAEDGRTVVKNSSNSAQNRGDVLSFDGGISVGAKANPKFYVAGIFGIQTPYEVSDCKVVQVDDTHIWITFLCEGEFSYIIAKL